VRVNTLLKLANNPVEFEGARIGIKEALLIVAGAAGLDGAGVPLLMDRLAAGDLSGAKRAAPNTFELALPAFSAPTLFNAVPFGANSAIVCGDGLGLAEQQGAIPSVASAWPDAVGRAVLAASALASEQAVCRIWTEGALATESTRRVVTSSIPTLITVGQLDDVTPPSLAARLGTRFTASRTVILANKGHAQLEDADPCTFVLHGAFIDAPQATLDASCAKGDGALVFVTDAGEKRSEPSTNLPKRKERSSQLPFR
jgi:pimeloyl-ACP methyl ester carboxylesterase